VPEGGSWTIILDDKKYTPDETGVKDIARIIDVLKNNPSAMVKITGINNSKKSSKKALHAANVISSKINNDIHIPDARLDISAEQTSKASGVTVTVQIKEAAK
jgi:hypothetical protein